MIEAQLALNDNPDNAHALVKLGDWYVFRGKWNWAAELLERAQAAGARVPALTLARCYWKTGRPADARKYLARAAEAHEAPAYYLTMFDAALSDSVATVENSPATDHSNPYADFGAAEFARAIGWAEDTPSYNSARKALCRAVAQRDDVFDAVAALRPNETTLWIGRGQARLLASRWADAAMDYAKVIDARPVHNEFVEYGNLLLLLGDDLGYRRLCERLVAREGEPRDDYAAYITARTCAAGPRSGVLVARVIQWAEQGAKAEPTAWRLHTRGLAHYRAGDFQAAISDLEASNDRNDWGQTACLQNWFVLAMAHHHLGQVEESRRYLEKGQQGMKLSRLDTPDAIVNVAPPDWVALHVLQREAEALLVGTSKAETHPTPSASD
jgi:tetratricopeptide (TPR) repeat protein